MSKKLDKKDISIMWELFQNSRIPISKIARKVKVPKETVKYRIEQLIKQGVIKNYHTIADYSKFGFIFYEVFVKLQGIPLNYEEDCFNKLCKYHYLAWLVSTSGRFSFISCFLVKTPMQFYESYSFIRELFKDYIKEISINVAVEGQQFEYPFFKQFKGLPIKTKSTLGKEILHKLNDIDYELLKILSENCRTPMKNIAQKLKITEKTAKSKIKSLEKKGYITQYVTNFHPGRVGFFYYIMLIRLSCIDKKIEEYIKSLPEIFYFVKGAGFFDLKVEFYVNSEDRIHEIEDELYQRFGNIISNMDVLHIKKEYRLCYFSEAIKT